ncbi:MAG: serine protease [Sandaracinaceae bacterium]|nr:serine protease [Sandaracinaceae bacterium]
MATFRRSRCSPATHVLRTRQPVFTVGYPLDASRRQAQSSRGIVGGVRDDGQVQLDMDVNPGNSGGPVIDEADQVVGMLVARGDVASGVQGVAVAVPLVTLHDALAQARERVRDGRVPMLPQDAARAAHVIDTLSRVGLMRILREASDVTEGTADTQTIQEIRALNAPGLAPDMQVFVAAFLWDAAQMLMFRAGDHVSPSTMAVGATRTLAEELLNEASALLRAAATADPRWSTARRSCASPRVAQPCSCRPRRCARSSMRSPRPPRQRFHRFLQRTGTGGHVGPGHWLRVWAEASARSPATVGTTTAKGSSLPTGTAVRLFVGLHRPECAHPPSRLSSTS